MTLFSKREMPIRPPDEARKALNFSWLRPGQLAGACQPGAWNPFEVDMKILAEEGVGAIVNLRERPYVLPSEWRGKFRLVHFHLDDFSVPTIAQMDEIVEVTEALLGERKPAVFHCMAGIGRTGVVLCALLMAREGASAHKAIAELARHRRGPQSDQQKYFLETEWERHLQRKTKKKR